MSPAQFWDDDPWLAGAYREANRLNIERKSQEMWLQGLYIHQAVAVAVGNAFRGKGKQPAKYMEEPIRLTPLTEAEKEAQAEKERQKLIDYLNKWKGRAANG